MFDISLDPALIDDCCKIYAGTFAVCGRAKAQIIATGEQVKKSQSISRNMTYHIGVCRTPQIAFLLLVFMVSTAVGYFCFSGSNSLLFGLLVTFLCSPTGMTATMQCSVETADNLCQEGVVVCQLDSILKLPAIDLVITNKCQSLTDGVPNTVKAIVLDESAQTVGISANQLANNSLSIRSLLVPSVLCMDPLTFLNVNLRTNVNSMDHAIAEYFLQPAIPRSITDYIVEIQSKYTTIVEERPFHPNSKYSGFVRKSGIPDTPGFITVLKGAPAFLLSHCTEFMDKEPKIIEKETRDNLCQTLEKQTKNGEKALAYAFLYTDDVEDAKKALLLDGKLVFGGFFIFNDRVLGEMKPAVQKLHAEGVRVMLVSGNSRVCLK